jgi:hypothetical protein
MRFSFPITKTEKTEDGRLLIEGVATSEALDVQGDILDYEGSKKAFEKWRGNLREAHDPKKPVGKALEVIPDDTSKTIAVRAFISAGAQDTQAKVIDGTLAMFSVGGGVPTKTKLEKVGGKPIRRVLEWPMTELSLVDVGANPDAAVSVAKAIGEREEEGEEPPPPPEGEEPEPKEEAPKEEPEPPAEEPKAPQLSESQLAEIVTKVTDAVLAAIEAKAKDKIEQPPAAEAPPEKSEKATEIRKDEEADVLSAACILDSLKNLRVTEGAEPEIETKQLAALARASAALAEFIALEAGEVIENAAAEPEPMLELAAKIDGFQKAVLDAIGAAIQKSAPQPDPRIDAVVAGIESVSKAVGDLKADTSGEVKALRKSMDQILSMPVPGRAPLRMITPEMAGQPVVSTATLEANALRKAAAGAPPTARDYLLNEANAIERG